MKSWQATEEAMAEMLVLIFVIHFLDITNFKQKKYWNYKASKILICFKIAAKCIFKYYTQLMTDFIWDFAS